MCGITLRGNRETSWPVTSEMAGVARGENPKGVMR
jgi:hypothetical protein